jgi:ATP-dependent DNA helicase RecQ
MQTPFNIQLIAKKSNAKENEIHTVLNKLKEKEIIEYHSKNNDATLIFNEIREDEKTINRVSKYLEKQNQLKKEQLQAVLAYVNEKKVCKNKLILDYFGEKTAVNCGICSYCITKKTKKGDTLALSKEIMSILETEDLNSRELQNKTKNSTDDLIFVLQELLEKEYLIIKSNNKYSIKL